MRADKMPLDVELQEGTEHGSPSFPIQYYVDELHLFENGSCPLHWHSELEFFAVRKGEVKLQVGNSSFKIKEGDGVFINMNVFHGYRKIGKGKECLCPNIVLSNEFIASSDTAGFDKYIKPIVVSEKLPFVILKKEIPWQNEILQRLDMVFSLLQKYGPVGMYGQFPIIDFENEAVETSCYELEVQSEMLKIWSTIFSHNAEVAVEISTGDHRLQIRMLLMLKYIKENFQKKITLQDIANSAGIGRSECTRSFKSYLGASPVDCLIDYRISKAKKLLFHGHENVEAVAASVGFESSAYFCRVFKQRVGATPKEYRLSAKSGDTILE